VNFPIDELSIVDDANKKLAIGGNVQILPNDKVDEAVVRGYFEAQTPPVRRLTPEMVWTFITNGAKKQRFDLAVLALPEYLASADQLRSDQVVAELIALDIAAGLGRAVAGASNLSLAQRIPPRVIARLTLHSGLADPEWLRTRGVSTVFRFASDVKAAASDELVTMLTARDLKASLKLVTLLENLYGIDDPQVAKIKAMWARALLVFEAAGSGDIDRLYTVIGSGPSGAGGGRGPELEVLTPVIIDALHAAAERALTAGKPAEALAVLSHVDFERRTDSTHALLLQALEALPPSSPSSLVNPQVDPFLRKLAQKDGLVLNAYADAVERQALYLVTVGLDSDIQPLLQRLIAVRPDPSLENDRLRIELAIRFQRLGLSRLSSEYQSAVRTRIPFSAKVQMILARVMSYSSIFVILGLMLLSAFLLWRGRDLRRRWMMVLAERLVRSREVEEAPEPEEEEDTSRPGGFSMLARAKGMSPSMQEYMFVLQGFGLTPEADLGSIKKAYRHAVKECHPDSNRSDDARASDKFIKITRAYDRLLELRQSQGLDG